MKTKRSQEKRITKAAKILRHMRLKRKLSLNQAASLLGLSGSAIAHMEQGRMDMSQARIETLIEAYQYSMEDYLEYFDGKELPTNYRDECLRMISQIDEMKVRAVHGLLVSFTVGLK